MELKIPVRAAMIILPRQAFGRGCNKGDNTNKTSKTMLLAMSVTS